MEKRIHLYVSRKNVLTWLMAFCLVGSAVARTLMYSGLEGAGAWSQIILPVIATLLYALIALISGKEMFYKTAVPVFLMGISYAIAPHPIIGGNPFVLGMFYVCILSCCIFYTAITSGAIRWPWLLTVLSLLPLAAVGYAVRQQNSVAVYFMLPDLLFFGGLFLGSLAVRVHSDDKYHPTWGDRSDGRRIRSLPPMAMMSPYLMVDRDASSNFFAESIEITNMDRYIRRKRREGLTDFGITHVLLAGYIRAVAKYPGLNRFLSGQRVYSRGEDIQYCMVIKKEMKVNSPDTAIKVHLSPRDTADDVYRKLKEAVESVKSTQELDSGFDNLAMVLSLIPGVFLKFVVWLLKLLDYFGLLPKFLLELSPFHGTMFFTSMGSLGIPPIYHHLYDFGNLPVFGSFGCKRRAMEIQEDGTAVQRRYVDIKFVMDERIVDGYYYATFFKYYRRLLTHPEVLDDPPEEMVPDID